MSMSSSTAVFIISLLAIPLTYGVNLAQTLQGEQALFVSGCLALLLMCFLTYFFTGRKGQPTDPLFYVFSLTTFASVVDLIIALENDGVVEGFMTNYLRSGEPYLKTAHGTMICYWDGIGHYAMYIMMLSALAWNASYKEVGLYWVGSIGHSMVVFLPGSALGKYGLKWSFLLNVPYAVIPVMCGLRFLREKPQVDEQPPNQVENCVKSIWKRPLDLTLITGLLASILIAFFRGFAVLGCSVKAMQDYVSEYEPYLSDPVYYPKMQMLVYLFYFVPFYLASIHGLFYPGKQWMLDWSLLHAGAAAQAQFTHIGASLHYRTPYVLRVPPYNHVRGIFWLINLLLLVLPQILAYRVVQYPAFFTSLPVKNGGTRVRRYSQKEN